jgi:Fe-S-cluster containining protein
MSEQPFYAGGLYFSCTRCSVCCRHEPGFVYLSQKDALLLAAALKVGYAEFVKAYCRWVPAEWGIEQLSLKEKSNYDCVFWKGGCSVYGARPLQCRIFPFWPSTVASAAAWESAAAGCPGIGRGELYTMEYIESCLKRRRGEPVLTKINRQSPGV